MQWEATGVDRTTGQETKVIVDAEDEAQAQRRANRRGLMVENVRPLDPEDSVAELPALAELARAAAPAVRYAGGAQPANGLQPVYVQVNNPGTSRGVSGFGIAALIFGIVACMAAWVPFVGLLSIPVAAVGALIGFIGILVSLIGRRSGVGMPVAGLFVSLLAVGLAVLATGITSAGIAHSVAAANMTNQTVPGAPMGTTEPPTSWAPAGSPVVQGDCQISIKTVRVGKVPLKGLGGETSTSTDDLLMIDVEIANQNATRKLDYKSWAGADFNFGRDFATLTDNFGNVYKRTTFGMDKPVGRVESQSIYPGSPITDQLAFEVPLTNIQFLHLEMPASNIGGDGMLRVEIPASMVQR